MHHASMIHGCVMQVRGYFVHMLGRLYQNQECSAARTLELVGERWSLLVLRYAASHRTLHHFCLLVAKRRHHPDLAIVASDADAETWLDIAQTDRGPSRAHVA
jgi:hypothetical protein